MNGGFIKTFRIMAIWALFAVFAAGTVSQAQAQVSGGLGATVPGVGSVGGTLGGSVGGTVAVPGGLGTVSAGTGGVSGTGVAGTVLGLFGLGGGSTNCGGAGNTIGGVMCNTVVSVEMVPGLLSGLAYLFGIILGAMGIAKLYEHVQNPNQVPVWDALKRFIAGGAFFALPIIIEATINTLTAGDEMGHTETGFNVAGVSGGGLDAMVVALMADIWAPMANLLWAFVYLAGVILLIVGISRLLKTAQEGPRGPGGIGTIMTFITAGALLSADSMLGAWTGSLFQTDTVTTYANMAFTTGMTADEVDHVHSVISAVLAFMMVLGWISFIRGWFILRGVAEGDQQASLMAGLTHLFGGALAVNLGPVMNAVQETFGLTDYGVNFT